MSIQEILPFLQGAFIPALAWAIKLLLSIERRITKLEAHVEILHANCPYCQVRYSELERKTR